MPGIDTGEIANGTAYPDDWWMDRGGTMRPPKDVVVSDTPMDHDSPSSAVILLSGGLDSATCLAMANEEHDKLFTVSFLYGQKHTREVQAASIISEMYGAEHRTISLPEIFAGSGSVIIAGNELDMPQMSYEDIGESYGVSPTYVPFRNANLLSMATSIALTVGAEWVYAGMHGEDALNWAYPDCTPEFLGAMASAIYVGSYHKVRLVTPLMHMRKADVVEMGTKLDVPFHLTLSCYEGTIPACGMCPTCVGRIKAFMQNDLVDPIPYAIEIEWVASGGRHIVTEAQGD